MKGLVVAPEEKDVITKTSDVIHRLIHGRVDCDEQYVYSIFLCPINTCRTLW